MVEIKHTKYYELKMRSNKVEYITATGLHCTMHNVKVPFFVLELSSRKIIEHRFHFNNDKVGSGIGYDIIIGRDLMVQLVLKDDFKNQVLQWYDDILPMK